jgi:hypothetical protein
VRTCAECSAGSTAQPPDGRPGKLRGGSDMRRRPSLGGLPYHEAPIRARVRAATRTHNFAVYGRGLAAKTQVRTAVSPPSLTRMCSLDGRCLIERDGDQRLRWSAPVWSPPPESNRRPHPYHRTTRNRCAGRPFPRSRPTVMVKVMGSPSAKVCVLLEPNEQPSLAQAVIPLANPSSAYLPLRNRRPGAGPQLPGMTRTPMTARAARTRVSPAPARRKAALGSRCHHSR